MSMVSNTRKMVTMEAKYLFASVALIFIVTAAVLNPAQGPMIELFDYWEHAASINELSNNIFYPQNPLLHSEDANTLRYTPYILLAALLKKIFHLELFATITLLSIASAIVFLIGVYLWSTEYFRDRHVALYVLITLLFFWGQPFNYSNEYSLRFFSYTLFYPSIITFNLSFFGLYWALKFVRYGAVRHFVFYGLIAIFIFVSHPLTGSFFMLCVLIMMITEGSNRLKNIGLYSASLAVIAVVLLVWPYHSFIASVIKSTTTDWYYPFRNYLYRFENIYKMGPALLGLPVILSFLINKKYFFITMGILVCAFIYVTTYFMNIRLGERYLFFCYIFSSSCCRPSPSSTKYVFISSRLGCPNSFLY